MRRAEVFFISLQKKETTTPQQHIALNYNSISNSISISLKKYT